MSRLKWMTTSSTSMFSFEVVLVVLSVTYTINIFVNAQL